MRGLGRLFLRADEPAAQPGMADGDHHQRLLQLQQHLLYPQGHTRDLQGGAYPLRVLLRQGEEDLR